MSKRLIYVLLPLVLMLSGCAQRFKEVKPTSFEIVSVSPRGLTSIDAVVDVGVHNPAGQFTVSDISCTVRYKGDPCIDISADPVTVARRSDEVYRIPLTGTLAKGSNPFQLLELLGNQGNMEAVTLDVSARAALRGGIGKEIEYQDVPLQRLLDRL